MNLGIRVNHPWQASTSPWLTSIRCSRRDPRLYAVAEFDVLEARTVQSVGQGVRLRAGRSANVGLGGAAANQAGFEGAGLHSTDSVGNLVIYFDSCSCQAFTFSRGWGNGGLLGSQVTGLLFIYGYVGD